MKNKIYFLVICVCLLLNLFNNSYVRADDVGIQTTVFPLVKGSYWLYDGKVKWTEAESGEVKEKEIRWKMVIEDVIARENISVAVVNGHPHDLAWYEEGVSPGRYLIITLNQQYYLVDGDRVDEVLSRIKDKEDILSGLVYEYELFLEMPLFVLKSFGETEFLTREDRFYSWLVENSKQVNLNKLKGFNSDVEQTKYRMSYRSLPAHIFVDFVHNLGIIKYTYSHHGTVSEAVLELVEYYPG